MTEETTLSKDGTTLLQMGYTNVRLQVLELNDHRYRVPPAFS